MRPANLHCRPAASDTQAKERTQRTHEERTLARAGARLQFVSPYRHTIAPSQFTVVLIEHIQPLG